MSWALHPLTEEQTEVQKLARDFGRAEIVAHSADWDQRAYFDPSLVQKLGELGFLGMMLPEQYEGLGTDTGTYLIALEEIAAADASVAVLMSVHNSLPTQMILRYGSEQQKDRFLRKMARGEILGAFALSEPDAGSDAAALTTQAVKDGKSWILNGTKSWVTNGSTAGAILTMARTDTSGARRGGRGIGAFIITPDLPGFKVGKKEDKLGLRASPTVQLTFDNMRVPAENLLIGIARAALEHSVAYAAERKQFGKPLKEFEAIQFKLADMAMRVAGSRALLHAAAAAKDRGQSVGQFSSMSKLMASETAMWVTTQAVQIFGGYGYVKDYPVERLMRDAKVTEIYEGTSEIQRIVIARALYSQS